MTPGLKLCLSALLLLGLAAASTCPAQELFFDSPYAKTPTTSIPATNAPPPATPPDQAMSEGVSTLLGQSFDLLEKEQLDAALEKANAAIALSPKNIKGYELRGSIYAEKQLWSQAENDYRTVLRIDDTNSSAKFHLPELKFRQKKYDDARFGFVALEQDENLRDLVSYKVFLCDLFGGHEDVAARELQVFNDVGSNPSYYYANAAWLLFHHQADEAKGWLQSAIQIYSPLKNQMYASSLIDLGYLTMSPTPTVVAH